MYQEKFSVLFRKYALPQMADPLLNSVYLIVDGVFIGNRLGRDAMAAAAISVPVIEILIGISLAISSGTGVLILLPYFLRKKGNLFISRTVLRLREGRQMLKLGFPAFIMEFSIGIVTCNFKNPYKNIFRTFFY